MLTPEQWTELLEREYVYRLTHGDLVDVREIWQWTRRLRLEQPPRICLVLELDDFHARGHEISDRLERQVRGQVARLARQRGLLAAPGGFGQVVALLPAGREAAALLSARAQEAANAVREEAAREPAVSVSVGIGDPRRDPRELPTALREAQEALRSKFFVGRGVVLTYAEARRFGERDASLPARLHTEDLMSCLSQGDLEGVHAVTGRFVAELGHGRVAPSMVRSLAVYTLGLAVRELAEVGVVDQAALERFLTLSDRLWRAEVLEDLAAVLQAALGELASLAGSRAHASGSLVSVRRVEHLVRSGRASGRNLRAAAREVNVSPSHLSRLFRRVTGVPFSAYSARIRVERACALLLATDLPLRVVAARVGYRHQSQFTRAFKRRMGMCPSQFRRTGGSSGIAGRERLD